MTGRIPANIKATINLFNQCIRNSLFPYYGSILSFNRSRRNSLYKILL
jgi:hypothetical protein